MSNILLFLASLLIAVLVIGGGLLYVAYTIEPEPRPIEEVVPNDRFEN